MNDINQRPDDDLDPSSFWQRIWPILIGIVVALALAAVGYWAGTRDRGTAGTVADSEASDNSADMAASGVFSTGSEPNASAAAASGVVFQGAFNPTAALQAIFGEVARKGSETFGRWSQPRLPPSPVFQAIQGRGPLLVSSLGIHPVQAGNEAQQLILFQSVPEDPNYGRQTDGAVVGAALFRPAPGGWELVRETRAITAAGSFGQAPSGKPLALGPAQWGLLFEGSALDQGTQSRYALLVDQNAQGFYDTGLKFDLGADNKTHCADNVPDAPPCFSYTGQLRVNPAAGGERFPIELINKGTRLNSAGEVESFVETRQFKFQAGRYSEDSSKHVIKVRPLVPPPSAQPTASLPSATGVPATGVPATGVPATEAPSASATQ